MYNPFTLENKTVLITGASSGIGRATAIECSKLNASVIITGRNTERLNKTFSLLEGTGHIQLVADLTNTDDIEMLSQQLPAIDGCVQNAGIATTILTQYISEKSLNEILQINTIAPIRLTQLLVKKKKLNKNASIVFTSSVSGTMVASYGNVLYSTSKGAINGFIKNAALDLAPKKIRVNSVTPGVIQTEIFHEAVISQEQLIEDIKKYPLKRHGKPEEVAFAIIYLLSDASAWVTGSNLLIDGGLTLQ